MELQGETPARQWKSKEGGRESATLFLPSPSPVRPGALRGPFRIQVTVVSFHKTFWEKDMLKEKRRSKKKENRKVPGREAKTKKCYSVFFFFAKKGEQRHCRVNCNGQKREFQ